MAVSVRTRFEVFKRDSFTCRYCGRTTPSVVLEIDHLVPVCQGGQDDTMNLVTSCWDCNRGKSGVPLSSMMTGEDPHDRAIFLMERERQLLEYNQVLVDIRDRVESDAWNLWRYWHNDQSNNSMPRRDLSWFIRVLESCPTEVIRGFMDMAIDRGFTSDLRWVKACVRNWRQEQEVARG